MAVSKNPYEEWRRLRSSSDYRSTDTQVTSLVRQQLSQAEYLRSSSRVNQGPRRNSRVTRADSVIPVPHFLDTEDMWGWQRWATGDYCYVESELTSGLVERSSRESVLYADGSFQIPETSMPDNQGGSDPAPCVSNVRRSFEYRQVSPATVWTIEHNLGFLPSVELLNADRKEIDADITHISSNVVRINFVIPTSGYARLN